MYRKPTVAIVGAGKLGSALAISLHHAGISVQTIVAHTRGKSLKKAQQVARRIGAQTAVGPASFAADVVWFCVPDAEIARAARRFSSAEWGGKIALHSSGVLPSDELNVLRKRGASAASVHPMMTFVVATEPSLRGVPFAIEGDRLALRAARSIVRSLGGTPYLIAKADKPAYHAWGTFVSPLLTSLLATAEHVAGLAGVAGNEARRRVTAILMRTLKNYSRLGAAAGFSGPIIRGDLETVRQHLRVLQALPPAHRVYRALASSALEFLPTKNKSALKKILESKEKTVRTRTRLTRTSRLRSEG